MGLQLDEKDVQVTAREGPLERLGGMLIAALECDQAAFECREICEVARREELALNDGEVDLDLVEPAGMDWCVNQNDVWPRGSQPSSGSPAAMGRTVVGDEEHTSRGAVRLLAHDLSDKALERSDAVRAFASGDVEQAVTSGVCAAEPECWSSRQCTERNRATPVLHLSNGAGKARGRRQPCGRTADRAGISRCGDATAATRPG